VTTEAETGETGLEAKESRQLLHVGKSKERILQSLRVDESISILIYVS
jgi:hypothetical protein